MSTYENLMASGKVRVEDGWHVHAFYLPYLEVARQSPPRDFGVFDQLFYELRRPSIPWAAWLVAAGSIAYGAIERQFGLCAFGLGFAAYLLFMAYKLSREWQSMPLVVCRLDHVTDVRKRGHGLPHGELEFTFKFHGRSMKADVAADSLEYLRQKGHVHFEALLLVSEQRSVGLCLAVRAADSAAPTSHLPS